MFFHSNPVLFVDNVVKNKRGLELVTSVSSGHETSLKKFLKSLHFIWRCVKKFWCNVKKFLSYSKNYICKFMHAKSWHHKLFHFHFSFWIWEVWRGREKITKNWIFREWKELFRWNKKAFFVIFKGLSFGEKIKIW